MKKALNENNLDGLYSQTKANEETNKKLLIDFDRNYKDTLNEDNFMDILQSLKQKEDAETITKPTSITNRIMQKQTVIAQREGQKHSQNQHKMNQHDL